MKLSRVFLLVFLLFLVIGAFVFYPKVELYFAGIKTVEVKKETDFFVHTGASFNNVVDSLVAKKIISNSSSAIAASIKCVNSNFKDGENGYLTEISEFSNCFQSEDFIEGTNAFIKKRKANFK